MPAGRHLRPLCDICDPLDPRPRWDRQFFGKMRDPQRWRQSFIRGKDERVEAVLLVEPERGIEVAAEPVERDIGQNRIQGDNAFEITVAVRPRAKLL